MKRIYYHYEKWEDWKDGLYKLTPPPSSEILTSRAARLLANPEALHMAMTKVIDEWRYASDVNLSNLSRNRRAWLGQAACCFLVGAPESQTKAAWHTLSPAEQIAANSVADEVIAEWEARCLSAD